MALTIQLHNKIFEPAAEHKNILSLVLLLNLPSQLRHFSLQVKIADLLSLVDRLKQMDMTKTDILGLDKKRHQEKNSIVELFIAVDKVRKFPPFYLQASNYLHEQPRIDRDLLTRLQFCEECWKNVATFD